MAAGAAPRTAWRRAAASSGPCGAGRCRRSRAGGARSAATSPCARAPPWRAPPESSAPLRTAPAAQRATGPWVRPPPAAPPRRGATPSCAVHSAVRSPRRWRPCRRRSARPSSPPSLACARRRWRAAAAASAAAPPSPWRRGSPARMSQAARDARAHTGEDDSHGWSSKLLQTAAPPTRGEPRTTKRHTCTRMRCCVSSASASLGSAVTSASVSRATAAGWSSEPPSAASTAGKTPPSAASAVASSPASCTRAVSASSPSTRSTALPCQATGRWSGHGGVQGDALRRRTPVRGCWMKGHVQDHARKGLPKLRSQQQETGASQGCDDAEGMGERTHLPGQHVVG
jgi:hypothetical protein